MMEPGESIDDYINRRVTEALSDLKVTDIQQLPLAALRRWNENLYQEFENDSPLETRLPLLTALPQGPQDGQVIAYDAGDGITWRFRYNAGSASAYKWEYIGGPALWAEVTTEETTASAAYVDLATVGPSVTCPLAGDYNIHAGATVIWNFGETRFVASVKIGAAATNDNERVSYGAGTISGTVGHASNGARAMQKTALAAGTVLKLQYRSVNGNTSAAGWRFIETTPIRVG